MRFANDLPTLVFLAGAAHLGILIASALTPIRLSWREELAVLSRLHRQMYWVYGGYVVLAIISLGTISIFNANELAEGSGLARGVCGYAALFWGIRLSLQGILDVQVHLTTWWLKIGYRLLTFMFAYFAIVFTWAALMPVSHASI